MGAGASVAPPPPEPNLEELVCAAEAETRCGVRARYLAHVLRTVYVLQRGVRWKQGVVVYILSRAVLLFNNTPIHRTPLPTHPSPHNEYPGRRTINGVVSNRVVPKKQICKLGAKPAPELCIDS